MKTIKIGTAAKTVTFAAAVGLVALGLSSPADAATGTMYGDPQAAAQWWRHQKYDDCVLMSSADVIGQVIGKEPLGGPSSGRPNPPPAPATPGRSTSSRLTPRTRIRAWAP